MAATLALAIAALAAAEDPAGGSARPNVIIILADDLGYGDLGCYGQRLIRTPNLDRLASEGVRFTQAYAGTTVCAPSRCALMTGLHSGHGAIRANRELEPEGQEPLPAGTFTVAQLFRDAGYATAAFGKWGLGGVESSGAPDLMGFTDFFGYNCQRRAHNYFPDHLWRNHERVPLDGRTYSPDLITAQALAWLRGHAHQPFFLFLPTTLPHAEYQVPDVGAYAQEPWPAQLKAYASMVTRMDAEVGEVCALVKELGIDDRTLVLFTSDQGADLKGALETFHSNGPFRGIKRSMYEGGLRVPAIARWPGRIAPGTRNDSPWAFYDVLPTVAALIGRPLPAAARTDGVSILPALLDGKAIARPFFYWELHEGPFIQAVRAGAWKGVRNGPGKPLELYDLDADAAEAHDLAAAHPEVVAQLEAILQREHVPDPRWPDRAAAGKAAGARGVDAR